MKKIEIIALILVFVSVVGYFGYKYLTTDNLKTTASQFVPAIKVGPKPTAIDEEGRILSHPDNAIYNLDKN